MQAKDIKVGTTYAFDPYRSRNLSLSSLCSITITEVTKETYRQYSWSSGVVRTVAKGTGVSGEEIKVKVNAVKMTWDECVTLRREREENQKQADVSKAEREAANTEKVAALRVFFADAGLPEDVYSGRYDGMGYVTAYDYFDLEDAIRRGTIKLSLDTLLALLQKGA